MLTKVILTLFSILLTNLSFAQTDFERVIGYYNKEKNFNGTVVVATNGKVDFLSSIGFSNRQNQTRVDSTTKFKIASITKTFTAVLILQLFEQGKLDLTTNFGKYYPDYSGEAKDKVTIQNLLTYSSGIPNTADKIGMGSYLVPLTLDEYIQKFCSENLEFSPGEKSIYSNTEYIILQKIIENITRKPFSETLIENIFNPLGMHSSGLLNSKDSVVGLTSSYTVNDSTQEVTVDAPYFTENFFGAGAMYSTAEDLLKFDSAIFTYTLLNKTNTALMLKPNPNLNGVAFGVWYADGYGAFTKPFIYRTGGILGSNSNWIHTLDDQKTIIVLSNTDGTNLFELSEQLYLVSKGQKPQLID